MSADTSRPDGPDRKPADPPPATSLAPAPAPAETTAETTAGAATGTMADTPAGEDPFAGLPPADTERWVVRRKAQIVEAVEEGVISLDQACAYYDLSLEEFTAWRDLVRAHGTRALRVTRVQDYRPASRRARDGS